MGALLWEAVLRVVASLLVITTIVAAWLLIAVAVVWMVEARA